MASSAPGDRGTGAEALEPLITGVGTTGVGTNGLGIAGVGIDAVEVSRLRQSLERTPTLVGRLFTAGEQADCRNDDGSWRYWKLAARFAAKEAVAKAFGTGLDGFGFIDVEVRSDENGKPGIRLAPPAARVAEQRGVGALHVSLTHTGDLAFAQVVAERSASAPR